MDKYAAEYIGNIYKGHDEKLYQEFQVWVIVVEFKQLIANSEMVFENYSEDEQQLINKIMVYMEKLPEEYHKCIGCPCNEHDYPACAGCPYYKYCIHGLWPYPEGCRDGDCQKMRQRTCNIE